MLSAISLDLHISQFQAVKKINLRNLYSLHCNDYKFCLSQNCPLQIDHACLFSISASEEHSVPLLRCEKSPGLCYSVTFSKRNKVLDLKPPRAWKIIQTTEESTCSHPKAQHANKKNCFCEHYAQCFKMFDTCDVMLHIYMRHFHKTFY